MIKQIKKQVASLLLLATVCTPFNATAAELEDLTIVSEDANQKPENNEPKILFSLISKETEEKEFNFDFSLIKEDEQEIIEVEEDIEEEEVYEYKYGWVNDIVNLYAEPNIDSEIINILDYNTYIYYISIDNNWSKVKYNDTFIYIENKFISDKQNESLSPYCDIIDSFTEDEIYLIYQITFAESGNQSIEGQRAVIEVILNRIMSEEFPNDLQKVLSQPGQFSTWRVRNHVEHTEEQEKAFNLVYNKEPLLGIEYVIFNKYKFNWGKDYKQIGNHWFGTL